MPLEGTAVIGYIVLWKQVSTYVQCTYVFDVARNTTGVPGRTVLTYDRCRQQILRYRRKSFGRICSDIAHYQVEQHCGHIQHNITGVAFILIKESGQNHASAFDTI